MADPKPILAEIKKARERVDHWKQWRNEPSGKKKLGHWRRRLRKALKQAKADGVEVPKDPFAPPPPPPPPPTPQELHQAALSALKARQIMPWLVGHTTRAWTPWGDAGWSAVDITDTSRIWCRAHRVDPRTGETVTKTAKVRRERLIKRDPELHGKDKPTLPPVDVFGVSADPEAEDNSDDDGLAPAPLQGTVHETQAQRLARVRLHKPASKLTEEEQAERDAAVQRSMDLCDDVAEDW